MRDATYEHTPFGDPPEPSELPTISDMTDEQLKGHLRGVVEHGASILQDRANKTESIDTGKVNTVEVPAVVIDPLRASGQSPEVDEWVARTDRENSTIRRRARIAINQASYTSVWHPTDEPSSTFET